MYGANPRLMVDFSRYHAQNPHVYDEFVRFAQTMRSTGRVRYSAKAIMEQIRWHRDLQTTGSPFKLSNSFTALYVRLLIQNEPSFRDFFILKSSPGEREST